MKLWRLALLLVALAGCGAEEQPFLPASSNTPLNQVELQYYLVDVLTDGRGFGALFDCGDWLDLNDRQILRDRVRPTVEARAHADPAGFKIIQADQRTPGDPRTFSDAQSLAFYQKMKLLDHIWLEPLATDTYSFTTQIDLVGGGQVSIRGRVTDRGAVYLDEQEPFNYLCPVCLAETTLIATPAGNVPVTALRPGDLVWTAAADGSRVSAPLLRVGRAAAPPEHQVIRLALADGRAVTASPRHPAADGRPFAALRVGAELDGSRIAARAALPYGAGWTYDILPAGATGAYWANGVLLGSTLR